MPQTPPHITTIGGQALLEGLLMVGPHRVVMALRRREGITIEDLPPVKLGRIAKIPVLRGAVALGRQLLLGGQALIRSGEAMEEDERLAKGEATSPPRKGSSAWLYASAMAGALLGLVVFILLPGYLASLFFPKAVQGDWLKGLGYSTVEGLIRLVLLVGYMAILRLNREMRRLWQYHGAEHKAIACYEAGLPLEVEYARAQPRFHPRCGTSFLFLVIFVSILLFSLVGWHGLWVNLLLRLALLPLLMGLSYELLRFTGRHAGDKIGHFLAQPGLWVQRLTTAEPDDAMLQLALASVETVLPETPHDDRW